MISKYRINNNLKGKIRQRFQSHIGRAISFSAIDSHNTVLYVDWELLKQEQDDYNSTHSGHISPCKELKWFLEHYNKKEMEE